MNEKQIVVTDFAQQALEEQIFRPDLGAHDVDGAGSVMIWQRLVQVLDSCRNLGESYMERRRKPFEIENRKEILQVGD